MTSPYSSLAILTQAPLPALAALVHGALIPAYLDLGPGTADLFQQGWQHFDQGNLETALVLFQQLLGQRQRQGDWQGVAIALNCLAFIAQEWDSQAAPAMPPQPSLPQTQALDDGRLHLITRGSLHRQVGEWQQALNCYQLALTLYTADNDMNGVGICLNSLGITYLQMEQWQQAISLAQASVSVLADTLDRLNYATALHNLGVAYYRSGNSHQALSWLEQALAIRSELCDRSGEMATLSYIGQVYCQQQQYWYALACFEAALDLSQQVGDTAAEATVLSHLARLCHHTGHTALALQYSYQALSQFRELDDYKSSGRLLGHLGGLYENRGHYSPHSALSTGTARINQRPQQRR